MTVIGAVNMLHELEDVTIVLCDSIKSLHYADSETQEKIDESLGIIGLSETTLETIRVFLCSYIKDLNIKLDTIEIEL